jgi:hypothetical protein
LLICYSLQLPSLGHQSIYIFDGNYSINLPDNLNKKTEDLLHDLHLIPLSVK